MSAITLPISITLYVTDHCQHACKHCFLTRHNKLNKKHIDLKLLTPILETAAANGVFLVAVAGGDPFLHPQIAEILESIASLGMRPLLASNPSQELESFGFDLMLRLKIPTIQFSLDSATPKGHNTIRGEGHFEKTLNVIQKAQLRNIQCNLSVCLTRTKLQRSFVRDCIGKKIEHL